jgi:hypothetical protein
MRVTLLDQPNWVRGGIGPIVASERRMFHLPARLRVEADELPCTVEVLLSWGMDERVNVQELVLRRETGEQFPITTKTLRAIRLEEVRRRALEHVTSVMTPDDSPLGWHAELAPFQVESAERSRRSKYRQVFDDPKSLKALGVKPTRKKRVSYSGDTAKAIKIATTPKRRGRAPSLNDEERATLERMVADKATVHQVMAKLPGISRTVAYREMATARDRQSKKGRRR